MPFSVRTRAGRVILVAAALWLGPTAAYADTIDHVSVGDHIRFADGPGTTGGGEFTLTDMETLDTFISFCLQKTEYLDFSTLFTVGGITRYATSEDPVTGGNGSGRDYLSRQTQYLYTEFRNGTLPGYNGTNSAANNLQRALWWFEGEDVNPGNAYVTLANNAVANGYRGNSRVRVLNIYYPNRTDAQDQLTLVPEPGAIAMLGVGLSVAAWRLRRHGKRKTDV